MKGDSARLNTGLSEAEERLILRYLDRQASLVDKFRIKSLLTRNAAAGEYLSSMKTVGEKLRAGAQTLSAQSSRIDLWDRISNRIDQEERAELFLGRRQGASLIKNPLSSFMSKPVFLGFGSLATAAVILLILPIFHKADNSVNLSGGSEQLASRTQDSGQTVSLASIGRERPRIIEEGVPTSMEVDWMRSNGRVRMIQDPTDSSAIIWVKKRGNQSSVYHSRRSLGPLPTLVEQSFERQR